MKHLTSETLARLVDESAAAAERDHLERCEMCRDSLASMSRARALLAGLSELPHPPSAWGQIEARLQVEGLVASVPAASHASSAPRVQPGWLQAAAGIVLFAAGLLVGAGWSGNDGDAITGAPDDRASIATGPSAILTLEEAEELVDLTQQWHLDALEVFRAHLDGAGSTSEPADPVLRFLLLDELFTAAEFAVRESPADPFLNGLFVSTAAERQVALDEIAWAFDP